MKKKTKLKSTPSIRRKLFKIASLKCREKAKFACEICGMVVGTIHPITNKKQKVEAHHVMSRSNKGSPLKFDLRNLVCLCTEHHKTGKRSAHKHGLWFANWFLNNRPDDAKWIIEHTDDIIDLNNRDILAYIEKCLTNNEKIEFKGDCNAKN